MGRRPDPKAAESKIFTASPHTPVDKNNGSIRDVAEDAAVSVVVCGPSGSSRSVRKIVGQWIWKAGRK